MRSRVTPKCRPTSSSVCSCPSVRPKRIRSKKSGGISATDGQEHTLEEVGRHFGERVLLPVCQTEAHFEHLALPLVEHQQRAANLLLEQLPRSRIHRPENLVILDKVTEQAGVFLANRHFERHWFLRDAQNTAHLVRGTA